MTLPAQDGPNGLRLRTAARAVVLDPAERILLVRFEMTTWTGWATPGGGLADGETHEGAIRRELAEEVGLADFELGPTIWHRTHIVPFLSGQWDGQTERFFLVRTPDFTPAPHFSADELRAEHVTAWRWWTMEEMETASEAFAPRELPRLMRQLLREGPPPEPMEVGV